MDSLNSKLVLVLTMLLPGFVFIVIVLFSIGNICRELLFWNFISAIAICILCCIMIIPIGTMYSTVRIILSILLCTFCLMWLVIGQVWLTRGSRARCGTTLYASSIVHVVYYYGLLLASIIMYSIKHYLDKKVKVKKTYNVHGEEGEEMVLEV